MSRPTSALAPPADAREEELAMWLATAELPSGSVEIAANEGGFVWWRVTDLEVWRRAMMRDLFPPDRPTGETVLPYWTTPPEMLALRRRVLLLDIARVREALRLGRPLTATEDRALRSV